jgi:hypothetical protein
MMTPKVNPLVNAAKFNCSRLEQVSNISLNYLFDVIHVPKHKQFQEQLES